jgi:hypothetical protein
MKRYLNKVREITVSLSSGYKYITNDISLNDNPLANNEIFIGKVGEDQKGLFIKKSDGIYSLSFDDFSYGFMNTELTAINTKIATIVNSASGLDVPTVPDEDGGL